MLLPTVCITVGTGITVNEVFVVVLQPINRAHPLLCLANVQMQCKSVPDPVQHQGQPLARDREQ